ncbi:MAG: bifunctional 5,10-methylenetetrahydrofolate dehydrogenase/5,10-methenyltetrahydrofolate cyclohydrolase [Candidatus Omnitrophica bacterium]|nr:bifunctional 5,10-methylenetetrahydrofolate dehydrogenase/5,10-methenyltetrahydrofolate cyclohydrolase [Candidatus Omnitrophota bacterium]
MAGLLLGKTLSESIYDAVRKDVAALKKQYNKVPALCTVLVGEVNEATLYVEFQKKIAQKLGLGFFVKKVKEDIAKKELLPVIQELNKNKDINGVIIQLPLPKHLDVKEIGKYIALGKDVEGIHPENLGRVLLGQDGFAPCTAKAVIELLEKAGVDLYGKEVVIIGHSAIVGKPLSMMFMNAFSTVTVCHIATSERGNLKEYVKKAEILVVAVGKPNLIKGEWIKPQAVVIDVGINCVENKVIGDVEFATASERASLITPVPGGVGPVTVAILMRNLIKAAKAQFKEGE